MLLPEPVGATDRTSRPASIAATTSDCPGLNASSPKTSLSVRSALSITSPECDGISRRDQRPLTRRSAQRRSGCSYPGARGGFADALRRRRRSSDAVAGGDADAAGYPAVATGSPRRRDRPSVHRDRLEGTHELQRSELGMDHRQGSGGQGEACPGGRVPAWWSGTSSAAAAASRIVLLRFYLPECSEPAPGGSGDGCRSRIDHATALERNCSPPHTGAADKCPTLLRSADGLANWSIWANHAQTGR